MDGKAEGRSQKAEDDSTATANDTFRIDRLTLKNFRCFEEKTIDFHPRFNVLIGDNGSGKTAVLDALAMAGALFQRAVGSKRPQLDASDARLVTGPGPGLQTTEPQFPVSAECEGVVFGEEQRWSVRRRTQNALSASGLAWKDALGIVERVRNGETIGLPLIGYYGCYRFATAATGRASELLKPQSRIYAYEESLAASAADRQFLRWLKTVELVRLQDQIDLPALHAVKHGLAGCIGGLTDIVYRVKDDELWVLLEGPRALPYRALPGGVRGMLAMVADMVWRASYLNPDLGADAARETPGVVLIDEIDLHLHPSWQRRVVDDLKRAFPKVQFIVTTHSPFIIQSLEPGELLSLDAEPGQERVDPQLYYRKSIEDITEDPMGVPVPSRSEKFQEMVETAEEYFGLLREGEAADAPQRDKVKQRLDALMARFSDDPAWVALLKAEREASGLEAARS